MIGFRGVTSLDLRSVDSGEAARMIDLLHTAPAGSTVVIEVGGRLPAPALISLLREHLDQLEVQVHADDPAVWRLWQGDLTTTGWR